MQFTKLLPLVVSFLTIITDTSAKPTTKSLPRLDKARALVLIVDHQVGLFHTARDRDPTLFASSLLAHAHLGPLFSLPTILTTSAETGPNGPLPREILSLHPTSPIIRRNGEVNAWDNASFRSAVRATNRTQVVLAGITTDVCTTFLALSLVEAGYDVFANADASGTFDAETRRDANERMREGGVQVLSFFAVVMELMRDWRASPGVEEVLPFLDRFLPAYGYVARGHAAAVLNGTVAEVNEELVRVE